jgi:hypothetical protein
MKLLSYFLFLIQFSAFSQVKSILIDAQTEKPVPYASVYIKNTERGTSSNLDGSFTIEIGKGDTIIISSIGYKNLELPLSEIDDTTFMENEIRQLNEVTIMAKRKSILFPERIVIGKVRSSFFANNYWLGGGGKPFKIAKYFNFKSVYKKTRFIESITLETLSEMKGAKFSINFYTQGKNGMPDQPILEKFIIVKTKKGRNKVKISLINNNIFFPEEGFFLVIQYLNIKENRLIRENYIEYAGNLYKYKYDPYISLVESETPQFYTFNIKQQKWVLSKTNLREVESELVLTE